MKAIHFKIEGEGQPMVFLHGWGLSSQTMEPLYEAFKSQYKVCVIDLPGFGISGEIEGYETFDDYLQWFADFLREQELMNPIIVAHSFGCRLAIRYAAENPCCSLVLTGAAGIKKPLTMKKKLAVMKYKLLKQLGKGKQSGSVDYQQASPFLKKVLVQVINEDLSVFLTKIKAPTLLIFGDEDHETPLWMGQKMVKLIPTSAMIIFEGDDHFAYLHQMKRFIAIIHHFIEGGEETC